MANPYNIYYQIYSNYKKPFIPFREIKESPLKKLSVLDVTLSLQQMNHPWRSISLQFEEITTKKNQANCNFFKDVGKIEEIECCIDYIEEKFKDEFKILDESISRKAAELLIYFYLSQYGKKYKDRISHLEHIVIIENKEKTQLGSDLQWFKESFLPGKKIGTIYSQTKLRVALNSYRSHARFPVYDQKSDEWNLFTNALQEKAEEFGISFSNGNYGSLKIGLAPKASDSLKKTLQQGIKELDEGLAKSELFKTPSSLEEFFDQNYIKTVKGESTKERLYIKDLKDDFKQLCAGTSFNIPEDTEINEIIKEKGINKGSERKLELKRKAKKAPEDEQLLALRTKVKQTKLNFESALKELNETRNEKGSTLVETSVSNHKQSFRVYRWQYTEFLAVCAMLRDNNSFTNPLKGINSSDELQKKSEILPILTLLKWMEEKEEKEEEGKPKHDPVYKWLFSILKTFEAEEYINSTDVWICTSFFVYYSKAFKIMPQKDINLPDPKLYSEFYSLSK